MKNKLKIVLDTNILVVSISSKSKYHWIFSSLLNNKFELYVSNEILLEYDEIITLKYNSEVAKNVIRTLLFLENVIFVTPFFKWNLIKNDPDDNKFVDCYIVSSADFLVSNDLHFDCLKNIEFPKINVIKINEFQNIIHNLKKF